MAGEIQNVAVQHSLEGRQSRLPIMCHWTRQAYIYCEKCKPYGGCTRAQDLRNGGTVTVFRGCEK